MAGADIAGVTGTTPAGSSIRGRAITGGAGIGGGGVGTAGGGAGIGGGAVSAGRSAVNDVCEGAALVAASVLRLAFADGLAFGTFGTEVRRGVGARETDGVGGGALA